MRRCPTDGLGFKVNSRTHRPTADCLLFPSLSAVLTFYHFPSPPNLFLFFLFHTGCHFTSPYPPLSSLWCQSLLASLVPLSFTSSSSYLWPLPAISLLFFAFLRYCCKNCSVSSRAVSVSDCFFAVWFLIVSLSWCLFFRQLMENKITTIERGAFQDLKELERL